jgi:hypothetical protein
MNMTVVDHCLVAAPAVRVQRAALQPQQPHSRRGPKIFSFPLSRICVYFGGPFTQMPKLHVFGQTSSQRRRLNVITRAGRDCEARSERPQIHHPPTATRERRLLLFNIQRRWPKADFIVGK